MLEPPHLFDAFPVEQPDGPSRPLFLIQVPVLKNRKINPMRIPIPDESRYIFHSTALDSNNGQEPGIFPIFLFHQKKGILRSIREY
ncbi:MAG: hypothetical protein CVV30_03830 [Methanomicrobiales archaeon HGW-Methanomicrobiales-1]|jgi:hypothetical protein|nr:MAG: hypothetical protein CVV30_03830 [Methanomicrobiales archaeon HGW-Methanomicrobiales-1]